ncbi:hypothetical protein ACPUYX_11175 [Desulfosporosinus sp. SYSU MS00001]|uniref:hypothetical protein n=1 Tax=Desulfosporosinus sp. SYSU MS00001 TaxID=3416284 RepID=UPI003CE7B6EB
MAKSDVYHQYAVRLAANIWRQLSDYGRRRIIEVSDSLSLNKDWFEQLEEASSKDLFYSEMECSYPERGGNVLDFLKNSKECCIEYVDSEGNTKKLTKCKIKGLNHDNDTVTVLCDGESQLIEISKVLRCDPPEHFY